MCTIHRGWYQDQEGACLESLEQDRKHMEITYVPRSHVELLHSNRKSVIVYRCDALTHTSDLKRSFISCNTMLRTVIDINWRQPEPNLELYEDMPKVGNKVKARRKQLSEPDCLKPWINYSHDNPIRGIQLLAISIILSAVVQRPFIYMVSIHWIISLST